MIRIGIDDTDVADSPGTNQLARKIIAELAGDYEPLLVIRHQLLFDRRIPYTSKNGSASISLRPRPGREGRCPRDAIRAMMAQWFIEGSDPGLCIAREPPEAITAFGRRCQQEIVTQAEALALAARHRIYLQPLGGTGGGVIGALAAVGLAAGGNDGRVVCLGVWPDDLTGVQSIALLHSRGVSQIRCTQSGQRIDEGPIDEGPIDVGKHLRPNFRDGQVVLFVEPAPPGRDHSCPWRAVRLL